VLAFPLLWMIETRLLLGGAVILAALAYAVGRAAIARGAMATLPLGAWVTPLGESVMVAAAVALAIRATATHQLHSLGLAEGSAIVLVALVVHAVGLRLADRRTGEVDAGRKRLAAVAGLVGELALTIASLTVAAEALSATLSGPIGKTQLVTSPWPALLTMALSFVPMIRLSLVEAESADAPRRALEAAALTLSGILLVGLGGPVWWP
jgi:hypothetical protein